MIVTVSEDKKNLEISFETPLERDQADITFTKKIRNAQFRRGKGNWSGDVKFIKGYNKIPIGLWKELKDMCKRFGFEFKSKGLTDIINSHLDKDRFEKFCTKLTEAAPDIENRPQQIDAAFRALKYRYCMIHIATSGGKTMIEYMFFMWLFYHKEVKKVLIVCPDADLVIQTYQEFELYSKGTVKLNMCMVHGASKIDDISDYNIIIGNFQSLKNRPPEFFSEVDVMIVDECHRAGNNSIKYIFDSCTKLEYRLGMSGTIIVDKTADYFTLLAYLGPIVKHITKRDVIDKGHATEIEVEVFKLNYMTDENRKKLATLKDREEDGEKRFRFEQKVVRESKIRLKWICELLLRMKGNGIVFFIDVKTGYGKRIVEILRENTTTKEIYYIDGEVDKKLREVYKTRMEEGDNKILVASYDTFGTGKSVKNLHWGAGTESVKGEVIVGQVLGRGMRQHETKKKFKWIDIVDDYSIFTQNYDFKNYMMRHMVDRIKIYEKEGLKVAIHEIDLRGRSAFNLDQPDV